AKSFFSWFLPRATGEGDHAQHGGGGVVGPIVGAPSTVSRSPSPARFARRGGTIKRTLRAAFWSAVLAVLVAAGAAAAWVDTIASNLPAFPAPSDIPTSTLVVDRDGKLLRPFTADNGMWRLPVTQADIDPKFFTMLFGYEDKHFEEHD